MQERLFAHLSKVSDSNYKLVAVLTLSSWWESIVSFVVVAYV